MTRRKNPYSTRWDKQISLSRLTGDAAQLYSAFEMIQTALYYEGILIDLDRQLYMPALETWSRIYPEYLSILLDLAIQVNNKINISEEFPSFALEFFLALFKELDIMVNGEIENNINIYNRARGIR
jgi:hypothetical protein